MLIEMILMRYKYNYRKRYLFFILVLFFISNFAQNSSLEIVQNFTQKSQDAYLSEIIEIKNKEKSQFTTLAAYCDNTTIQTRFFYRVKLVNSWGKWKELKEDTEANNRKRKVFGLVSVFENFNKIQFKSAQRIADTVHFRLFFAGVNTVQFETSSNKEVLNCDLPSHCDRNCWCPSGNCDPQSSPYPTEVTHIIVHHSATNYSGGTDYAQVVYSYWDYHVNTHGWNDIGYNWLVDPNGVLYEGRGSGIQGAHFSCMNGHTMGVCVIGNFETATPTTETLAMLENLIAWEATDKNIDVLANEYHPPSQLNLYTISGHKDGNPSPVGCPSGTLCPGTHLYGELTTIRNDVSGFPCYITASTEEDTLINIRAFPNPVSEVLNIENATHNPIKEVLVYNVLGIKVNRYTQNFNSIDFSGYAAGLYAVKIVLANQKPINIQVIKN